jgi:SAM-dependent methyltransferase
VRNLGYSGRFDAAVCMWTSFGYFEKEADNLKALRAVNRALKKGGRFLIELINRDWLISNFQPMGWTIFGEGFVLEKRRLDLASSRLKAEWLLVDDGRKGEKTIDLRVYSIHEILDLLVRSGFEVNTVFSGRKPGMPSRYDRMNTVLLRKR